MRKSKTITIDGKKFTVYELTVEQITSVMEAAENNAHIHEIDMLFPDRLPSDALAMSMDMPLDELAKYAPSDLEIMIDFAEELNPTFAGLLKRLANLGREVLAAKTSGEPSAG